MGIIIIGAGVLGASAAFHLARMGEPVIIVDAQLEGRATAAGAGIICPWVSDVADTEFYRLYVGGGEYYPDLIAALAEAGEAATGYRRTGAMLVSGDAAELGWIERMALQRAVPAMGEVRRLSARDAQGLFPPLRSGMGGVFVPGGARVDGRSLAAALLRAAKHLGATVMHGRAAVVAAADRVVGVDVDGQRVAAGRVVVTAGAWTDPVLHPLGLSVSVKPQRGQIVHLSLVDTQTQDWPVILPPGSHYIVPFDSGRIVAGATRETRAGFDYRVTAAGQLEVLTEALGIAPGLATATLLETRVGFRPTPAGGLRPSLGWMPGVKGLAVGTGLGAAGLTIGPFAGRLLAELVTGRPQAMDLAPFDPLQPVAAAAVAPLR